MRVTSIHSCLYVCPCANRCPRSHVHEYTCMCVYLYVCILRIGSIPCVSCLISTSQTTYQCWNFKYVRSFDRWWFCAFTWQMSYVYVSKYVCTYVCIQGGSSPICTIHTDSRMHIGCHEQGPTLALVCTYICTYWHPCMLAYMIRRFHPKIHSNSCAKDMGIHMT